MAPSIRSIAGRAARKATGKSAPPPPAAPPAPPHTMLDPWLVPFFSPALDPIEASIAGSGPEGYTKFRSLDDDLWSLLLTLDYEAFPAIRGFLPDLPERALQEMWNGVSGAELAAQSVSFYRKLKEVQADNGEVELRAAKVLDFGLGWGRLTRMLARDVAPGNLYGCDPVEEILEVCRQCGVPAELARSEFLPQELPFDAKFDLVYSFSVFTHISEKAHRAALDSIHAALNPGGLLVVTVRPPSYIHFNHLMEPAVAELGPDPDEAMKDSRYVFAAHPLEEGEEHPQFDGTEMNYGETVVTMPYVMENWVGDGKFELADVSLISADLYQVAVTLKKV